MNKYNFPPTFLPSVDRIIAIGDIHGDYDSLILCLRKSGVIGYGNKWIGKKTILIQLGDQIDRGGRGVNYNDEDSEIKIINFFNRLHKQAVKDGGAVYSLIGNHELMNVWGDFSYTSPMGIEHFGSKKKRYQMFRPGGGIAILLANTRNAVMKIGDLVFVHGGIIPRLAQKYSLDYMNGILRDYLLGDIKLEHNKSFKELYCNKGGIIWTRCFSENKINCKTLNESLSYLNAKFLIVGHTPQDNGINCKCNKKVWRIDTGMSRAFGKKNRKLERIEALEILNNGEKFNII